MAAADLAARAAGIAPGLTLADARALVPDLKVTDADPQADIQALAALADWCGRYTPYAAVDGSGGEGGGLWLDITGCAHLFGGEAALLEDARARLARFGFIARAVVADTPGAAWAVARTAAGESTQIIAPDGARQALAELPVVGLRLPAETVAALERLGLACIGDLYQLPRAPLVARFGDALLRRLDQALGRAREPLSPRIPAPPYHSRLVFAEPIGRSEDVAAATHRLLEKLMPQLARERRGARRLELALYLVDGRVIRAAIGTSRATRDVDHLFKLFTHHLPGLDLGFGAEVMTLAASVTNPLVAAQLGFDDLGAGAAAGGGEPLAELGQLLDRLSNRLGAANVVCLAPRASYVPERAVTPRPPLAPAAKQAQAAAGGAGAGTWPMARARPVCLFLRPEPVEVMAPLPDDPPVLFRWRHRVRRVAMADGPERIAPEWWLTDAPEGGAQTALSRDYYWVEDGEGRRFWLFREGLYPPRAAADAPPPRWYVHGIFA